MIMMEVEMKAIHLTLLIWLVLISCTPFISDAPEPESSIVPTITPLPDFLGYLLPQPGSSYSLQEFEELAPGTGWGTNLPGICFSIVDPSPFLERGDFLSTEEWLSRISVTIDGELLLHYDVAEVTDLAGWEQTDPQTEEVLWRVPDGIPWLLCYATTLDVGEHTATITVNRTSSKQVSFSWSFNVMDE